MIVTEIKPVTKQKFQIELDRQPAFVLYKGELSRYHIQKDEELSEEIYRELVEQVLTKRAKLRAMHLLEKMDRTKGELRKKTGARWLSFHSYRSSVRLCGIISLY